MVFAHLCTRNRIACQVHFVVMNQTNIKMEQNGCEVITLQPFCQQSETRKGLLYQRIFFFCIVNEFFNGP